MEEASIEDLILDGDWSYLISNNYSNCKLNAWVSSIEASSKNYFVAEHLVHLHEELAK